MNFADFEKKLEEIRRELDEVDAARENLLRLSRELRRISTLAISNIHSNRMDEAENNLSQAEKILEEIGEYSRYEIFYPITREPMQEFVEAVVFLKLIRDKELKLPQLEKIHPSSILTGLADVAGELRRYILELLRKGEIEKAEILIGFMERIYFSLLTFSYPDKVVPGLRGKIDMIRLTLERTKSDLISAMVIRRVQSD